MIELFKFQRTAALEIADRYIAYVNEPLIRVRGSNVTVIPFYQALSSITGSGKTAILAKAVSEICELSDGPPVVLWVSKGKVVVSQTYANLTIGGKYNHLLGDMSVQLLSEYNPDDVRDLAEPRAYFATVGTFNQKDKESGKLRIHRPEVDKMQSTDVESMAPSTWDALRLREGVDGKRRPLVVVYDEAQNLSDQQTKLLLDLQPDAFLLASATLEFPEQFNRSVVTPLKDDGFTEDDLITRAISSEVVGSGLIKSSLHLDGINSPMQETISEMLAALKVAQEAAVAERLPFKPKAIYVCNTNVAADDAGTIDNPRQPFEHRQAPPIVIWRYLTEECGIPSSEVAVYSDLKTHKDAPLPEDFNLFSGGDKDYDEFVAGDFKHIIFNLALQEGWDDPAVYCAYVDKSMDSRVQITQVIGRVLRQPGAQHYAPEALNTARFYVRVDRNNVFNQIVEDVKKDLGGALPELKIVTRSPGKTRADEVVLRSVHTIPRAAIAQEDAAAAVAEVMNTMPDYSNDTVNTRAKGRRRTVIQAIGKDDGAAGEWEDFEYSSQVSVRWILRREVARRYPKALGVVDTDGTRFDARVGVGSPAFTHIVNIAHQVADAYIENAQIKQVLPKPYTPGSILLHRSDMTPYTNSIHEGYDGLNKLEAPFATALDGLNLPWARNPPYQGYWLPLISIGTTTRFFPDFVLWNGDEVLLLETKGEHLVQSDAGRKLLSVIPDSRTGVKLSVRLISRGKWSADGTPGGKDGFSLWGLRQDQKMQVKHFDDLDTLVQSFVSR